MPKQTVILAGDVGGTKVNVALCTAEGDRIFSQHARRYPSRGFNQLSEILRRYLAEIQVEPRQIEKACFGVPGPVIEGRCQTINLPWVLDENEISRALGIGSVRLVNDLVAMAYGIRTLGLGRGLAALHRGEHPFDARHTQALMAPGTGLGEALLIWDGTKHLVAASEGGHCDFGPQNDEQIALLQWLWQRHKHASWEHVASGPGIHRVYRFLKETGREMETPELAEELARPEVDPSPVIGRAALKGFPAICVRAIDLWLGCVGAEAGNLALKALSFGGLFIGGGVVPHLLELFSRPAFLEGFEAKGRMRELVNRIPIYAITDEHTALYGAVIAAREFVPLVQR